MNSEVDNVDETTEPAAAGRRRPRTPVALWVVALSTCVLTVVLVAGPVGGIDTDLSVSPLALAALIAAFVGAELLVVHLQFQGEAHTFTLTEVPLVLGLLFVGPKGLVLATVVGVVLTRCLWQRQPAVKQVFNMGLGTLDACLAALVYYRFSSVTGSVDPESELAALAACLAVTLVSGTLVAAAINLASGEPVLSALPRTLGPAVIVTVTNASLTLVAVSLVMARPQAAWLLVAPAAIIVLAYRAYLSERRERGRMHFLYSCSRALHEGADAETAVLALLGHAVGGFRASGAELILLPETAEGSGLRTAVGPGGAEESMTVLGPAESESLLAHLASEPPEAMLVHGRKGHALRAYLEERGVRESMVATLRRQDRVAGLLLVSDPLAEVGRFEPADVDLLAAMAAQVSVFLEYDRLGQALDQLSSLQGRLVHQAHHDPLTGLANRALLLERMARAHRAGRPIAVMFIDLDDFKMVNDELGHDAGDDLLVAVARRLEGSLRTGDLAARLGGDEFAVLVEEPGRLEDELAVADRILANLNTPFSVGARRFTVAASVGVASGDPAACSIDDLMANADLAMYAAKRSGKNRSAGFLESMRDGIQERLALEADLEASIGRGELRTVFQPVVELGTGRPLGFEALARWTNRHGNEIGPRTFIPVAEGSGLIGALGRASLHAACAAHRLLHPPEGSDLYASVNVSGRELQQPGFVDQVCSTLADHGLRPDQLVLEVAESTLLGDQNPGVERLQQLRAMGVRVAVDDFWTGYSSLSGLRALPVDVVKLDPSFVHGLGSDEEQRAFARAIMALATALGVSVVAEGVETLEEVRGLLELGCTMGQGHY
nr:EAL domain-containing protein [Acidimicrobiia bacterium]